MFHIYKSNTIRFREPPGPREVHCVNVVQGKHPGPTDYVIDKEVNYRSPFRHPRIDHLSFGSGKSRFCAKEIFAGTNYNRNPGPGQYEQIHSSVNHGTACGFTQRFKPDVHDYAHVGSTADSVGPGSYAAGNSLVKKSFNVTTETLHAHD